MSLTVPSQNKSFKFPGGISIIIPACKRKSYLEQTLKQLFSQKNTLFPIEIILVYKGSDFKEVVRKMKKVFKRSDTSNKSFKAINQSSNGTSRARNQGIIHSTFPIITFIDDDTIPTSTRWAERIHSIFKDKNILAACGKITIGNKLNHNYSYFKPYYTYWNKGGKAKFLPLGSTPPTAHLIVKKRVLLASGGFIGSIGRSSTSLMSGEDDELTAHLATLGVKYWYDPKLTVKHEIPKSRLTKKYLINRIFLQGPTDEIIRKHTGRFYGASLKETVSEIYSHTYHLIRKLLKRNNNSHTSLFIIQLLLVKIAGDIFGRTITRIFYRHNIQRPLDISKNT